MDVIMSQLPEDSKKTLDEVKRTAEFLKAYLTREDVKVYAGNLVTPEEDVAVAVKAYTKELLDAESLDSGKIDAASGELQKLIAELRERDALELEKSKQLCKHYAVKSVLWDVIISGEAEQMNNGWTPEEREKALQNAIYGRKQLKDWPLEDISGRETSQSNAVGKRWAASKHHEKLKEILQILEVKEMHVEDGEETFDYSNSKQEEITALSIALKWSNPDRAASEFCLSCDLGTSA